MIKDCNSCIHNRVNCGLKSKYNDYKLEMKQLIEKWGESNGFGFSLDCPSWYEEPNSNTYRMEDLKNAKDICKTTNEDRKSIPCICDWF